MKKSVKMFFDEHIILFISLFFSIAVLVMFLIFQDKNYLLLDLDPKWIIVSSIPLLIGFLLGGYIKSIETLGIKLKMNLKRTLAAEYKIKYEPKENLVIVKQSTYRMLRYNDNNQSFSLLQMTFGKDTYTANDLLEYLLHFRYLRYIVLVKSNGDYKFIFDIKNLGLRNINSRDENVTEYNIAIINDLITAIETNNENFFSNVVSDYIEETDNIINAYIKIKSSRRPLYLINEFQTDVKSLPLLNNRNKLIGFVPISSLEVEIAKQVVTLYE